MKQEITFISDQTSFIESLSAVIHEIFREELVNPKVKAKNKMEKEAYLTNDEVCSYLHISRSTLYRCVSSGVINCYKMNKRDLFKLQEVNAALMKLNA